MLLVGSDADRLDVSALVDLLPEFLNSQIDHLHLPVMELHSRRLDSIVLLLDAQNHVPYQVDVQSDLSQLNIGAFVPLTCLLGLDQLLLRSFELPSDIRKSKKNFALYVF